MPIYEYRCEQCGHELEKLQRMGDDPLRDCPACEQPQLRRLISAAGFRLKGGGWYETDFKNDNRRNLHESADKKSESKTEAKTGDTKEAAKKPAADKKAGDAKPAAKPASSPTTP